MDCIYLKQHLLFQSGSDTTDFMLNWLKDIPDNPAPVEPAPPTQQECNKAKKTTSRSKNFAYSYTPCGYQDNSKKLDKINKEYNYDRDDSESETDYRLDAHLVFCSELFSSSKQHLTFETLFSCCSSALSTFFIRH